MTRHWTAVFALSFSAMAAGGTVELRHPHGEPVDLPGMVVRITPSWPDRIDCSVVPQVSITQRVITVRTRLLVPGTPGAGCFPQPEVPLGQLEAGWWTLVLEILQPTGEVLVERRFSEQQVVTPGTTCNAMPYAFEVTVGVVPLYPQTGDGFLSRLATDSAYAELLGNPLRTVPRSTYIGLGYPLLDNPHDIRSQLLATGEFAEVWVNGLLCFPLMPDRFGRVVEYFNADLGHYFYTPDLAEQTILDAGHPIGGWGRTGQGFNVLLSPGCHEGRPERPTYRFLGKPGVGPRSHVFTAQRDECRVVDRSGAWIFEGSQFWATPTPGNGCSAPAEVPLHRLWKAFGEGNHRFTTDWAVVEEMRGKGWVYEGVRMCVKG